MLHRVLGQDQHVAAQDVVDVGALLGQHVDLAQVARRAGEIVGVSAERLLDQFGMRWADLARDCCLGPLMSFHYDRDTNVLNTLPIAFDRLAGLFPDDPVPAFTFIGTQKDSIQISCSNVTPGHLPFYVGLISGLAGATDREVSVLNDCPACGSAILRIINGRPN